MSQLDDVEEQHHHQHTYHVIHPGQTLTPSILPPIFIMRPGVSEQEQFGLAPSHQQEQQQQQNSQAAFLRSKADNEKSLSNAKTLFSEWETFFSTFIKLSSNNRSSLTMIENDADAQKIAEGFRRIKSLEIATMNSAKSSGLGRFHQSLVSLLNGLRTFVQSETDFGKTAWAILDRKKFLKQIERKEAIARIDSYYKQFKSADLLGAFNKSKASLEDLAILMEAEAVLVLPFIIEYYVEKYSKRTGSSY